MRPLGKITDDMEELLYEMVDDHKMQKNEVLSIIASWIDVHYPDAIEMYEDGSNPIFYYGPKDNL